MLPHLNKVSNGEFTKLNYTRKSLNNLKDSQAEFFTDLTISIEDLLDYVQLLEKEIQELNIKLVDNTPEHVSLVKEFIDNTINTIAKDKIKNSEISFSEFQQQQYQLKQQQYKLNDIIIKQKELSENARQYQGHLLILSADYSKLRNLTFWLTLPHKLTQDIYNTIFTYKAFTTYGIWEEITKETFERAINTQWYSQNLDIKTHKEFIKIANSETDVFIL